MTDFSRLWMFSCGSPANYVIDVGNGGDEKRAMEIATAFCKNRGIRPPATVRPFIAADPSILGLPVGEEPLSGVVEATSGSLMDKAKALIGR
jgi:hypothetical protein